MDILDKLAALAVIVNIATAAPYTDENSKWNVNFERLHVPEKYYGKWEGHMYFPSPADWRALSIYQLVTDRFADGDPRNNEALKGGFDVRDMTFRHGGDFAGLRSKLDYIKGLGCQAIWISPVFQNGYNYYHQYAQEDFTLLDRRLGTLDELRALTQAAHDRGMYVIIDIVMNHMGNEFFFEGHQGDTAPFRFHQNHGQREYRLITRRAASDLYDTPAGKQPYMDFYFNNTWVPEAQYASPFYGQYGEAAWDQGHGTYDGSDFHHNGDLQNYADPWEINVAKIYGTMDDLRLEHSRVQDKYIAMTEALIQSADVDGFRVDTPMQVPLPFYKRWAPQIRQFARSLGKDRFGLFGEFYVTTERYATMTGRGKDNGMYGQDRFIPGEATLKGGIVYPYYWYTFTALVYKRPQYADGFALAYEQENRMIDTFDPSTNRSEYAQWIFCNNHDNWRLQTLTGKDQLLMCLAVITFWPGLPLHYAGDEQDLSTPGSALDGWAREELSPSIAWSAVKTGSEGNPADRDNFDMTSATYRHIAHLNALRRAYFAGFGSGVCDRVGTPLPQVEDLLIFWRGCSEQGRVTVIANFHTEDPRMANFYSPWGEGTKLTDAQDGSTQEVVVQSGGLISVSVRPLQVLILVPGVVKPVPPAVVEVHPSHGAALAVELNSTQRLTVSVRFDRPMDPFVASVVTLDGRPGLFSCANAGCQAAVLELDSVSALADGFHEVAVPSGVQAEDGQELFSTFRSSFLVHRERDIIAQPELHEQPGLVCMDFGHLCHEASGAKWMRMQNVRLHSKWSEWIPYENVSEWQVYPGIPVLVQYHAGSSSSYIVGDCVLAKGIRCHASWHNEMFLRGDFNGWGEIQDGRMERVNHFTWAANVTLSRFSRAKFAPQKGWSKSYGIHPRRPLLYALPTFDPRFTTFQYDPLISGTDATRQWMVRKNFWSAEQSMASGAEFASELWIGYGCTAEEPKCPVPSQDSNKWRCYGFSSSQDLNWCRSVGTDDCWEYAENDWSSSMSDCSGCSCCRRAASPNLEGRQATCCVLFNDLTLNYTITSDLTRCAPVAVKQLPEGERVKDGATKPSVSQPSVECAAGSELEPDSAAAASQPDAEPKSLQDGATVEETLAWSRDRVAWAEREFGEAELRRMRSPADWNNEVVYSVMVDRFANGDITNDLYNIPHYQKQDLKTGEPWNLYQWRHGGDLLGILGRLTYMKHLGITVVALSPVFYNAGGEYHGYSITDLATIDPGFGDAKLLQTLVTEAHELGIRVVLDVQLNHAVAAGLEYRSVHADPVSQVSNCVASFEEVYRNSSGGQPQRSHQRRLSFGALPRHLQHQEFFARCGPKRMDRPHNRDFSNEPHTSEEYEAGLLWTEFLGDELMEFDTMNPAFQEVMTNLLKYWIAYADIDGLRLSSVAFVSADFTAYISTHLRHYAKKLGKEQFFLIGEVDLTDQPFGLQHLGTMGATHALSLPYQLKRAREELCPYYAGLQPPAPGLMALYPTTEVAHLRSVTSSQIPPAEFFQSPSYIQSKEVQRDIAAVADVRSAWTAAESYQLPRLLSVASSGQSDLHSWRIVVSLAWGLTWRGIPEIWYGSEFGFTGVCYADEAERQQLLDRMVEAKISAAVAEDLLQHCDYRAKGAASVDRGFWRQDMFSGGPMELGRAAFDSAAPSPGPVQLRAGLMEAAPPHWCEEPIFDRTSQVFRYTRAMIRIRRSCPALRSAVAVEAKAYGRPAGEQISFWKLLEQEDGTQLEAPLAVLVVLSISESPSAEPTRYTMPAGVHQDGQAYIDLLHPGKMAVVDAQGNESLLLVPGSLEAVHVSIFAPIETVEAEEGEQWLLCKGAELPPLEDVCQRSIFAFILTASAAVIGLAIPFIVLLLNCRSSVYLSIVKRPTRPEPISEFARLTPQHVLCAAIEHTIPMRNVKINAGGLGKVLDQMLREHPPGRLSLVHPKFGEVDYGELEEFSQLTVTVDGKEHVVVVYRLENELNGITRSWYLLEHPLFTERPKTTPYPCPMTKVQVLRYFSVWNQSVAALMRMLNPDIYHCMDYHAALAPLYLPEKPIPMILVLHNADYMGVIETDFINDRFWKTTSTMRRLSLVFNLRIRAIRKYVLFEGRFNMLKAGVAYIKEMQGGHGVCAVSANYAAELKRERMLFRGLPNILPLDNATDPADDQGTGTKELKKRRYAAKAALQKRCNLNEDPGAKILIFIGRWVKQKGVDHIAMLTEEILRSQQNVQLVLAGPPDDPFGLYAQEMLVPLRAKFEGRLFVCTEFFYLEKELRRGAHLCFTPSCSEPFGYVDVEFGLLGVPSVGCAIGGLGKMPGVYFRQQNADSPHMLLEAFACAIDYALDLPDEEYWQMAKAATRAEFPFIIWKENLKEAYHLALTHFKDKETGLNHLEQVAGREGVRRVLAARTETTLRRMSSTALVAQHMQVLDVNDDAEFLEQPVSEERIHEIMKASMARSTGAPRDAETLQSLICQAEQRRTEKHCVTQWLMKPFCRGICLRIHAVIALCYIFSPVGETVLKNVQIQAQELEVVEESTQWSYFYAGNCLGCLMWLSLSRGIPPNLLMAGSQVISTLFLGFLPFMQETLFKSSAAVLVYLAFCGLQSSSRLLFIIWNFNEDFQGGFQIAAKRIGMLESFRAGIAWLSVTCSYQGHDWINKQAMIAISLITLLFLFKAPHCYSAYVLPSSNFLEALPSQKTFLLLVMSEMMNFLAIYPSINFEHWWTLNGWTPEEIAGFALAVAILSPLVVSMAFYSLQRMAVWGPWVTRDFTCWLPPGALIRAVAVYDLGFMNHRNPVFVVAIIASIILDVARNATVWCSILGILGNKWYALKGGYLCMFVVAVSSAASPLITNEISMRVTGVSLLQSSHTLQSSATRGSMGQAVASTVLPLATTAYALQLLAMRYFNADTVSYKGHGSRQADGNEFGTEVSSVRLVVKEMKRKRKEKARQLLNNNSQSFDVGTQRAWFSNIFFSPTSPTSPGQSNPQFELPCSANTAVADERPAAVVEYSESWAKVLESYMEGKSIEEYTILDRHNRVVPLFQTSTSPPKEDFPLRVIHKARTPAAGPRAQRRAPLPRLLGLRRGEEEFDSEILESEMTEPQKQQTAPSSPLGAAREAQASAPGAPPTTTEPPVETDEDNQNEDNAVLEFRADALLSSATAN